MLPRRLRVGGQRVATVDVMVSSDDLFLDDSVLGGDPVDADGQPLRALHDREYRVRAFRLDDERVLFRGAVRDQKPPHLYFVEDERPLTIHHMQLDMVVKYPELEIVDADVRFVAFPQNSCPAIVEHYRELIGLSVARGFTHRVRELFGGPRACTHTTALLQAMAPVVVQTIWSLRAATAAENGGPGLPVGTDRRALWKGNINTCHVWAEDGEAVAAMEAGEPLETPRFAAERLVELGLPPDAFHQRMS